MAGSPILAGRGVDLAPRRHRNGGPDRAVRRAIAAPARRGPGRRSPIPASWSCWPAAVAGSGLGRPVRLCVASDETGPAVVGAWRPRIVLPEAVLSGFGRDRLEAILLHELAHVRRRDVVVHWLMTAARVLHWFNPIAWLALSRMAAEREQACDDVVIDVLGRSSRQLYGETMLRLLERMVVGPMVPGAVQFFGSRRRLQTRLESLTRPRRLAGRGKTIAISLLVALALLGLTDRVRSKAAARAREPAPTPLSTTADLAAETPEPRKEAAEVRLQGRVLDHLGKPVAGADVLLLAGEKLTVYATPGHPNVAVRLNGRRSPRIHRPRSRPMKRADSRCDAPGPRRTASRWSPSVSCSGKSPSIGFPTRTPRRSSFLNRRDPDPVRHPAEAGEAGVPGLPADVRRRRLGARPRLPAGHRRAEPRRDGDRRTAAGSVHRRAQNNTDHGSWGILMTFCEQAASGHGRKDDRLRV